MFGGGALVAGCGRSRLGGKSKTGAGASALNYPWSLAAWREEGIRLIAADLAIETTKTLCYRFASQNLPESNLFFFSSSSSHPSLSISPKPNSFSAAGLVQPKVWRWCA